MLIIISYIISFIFVLKRIYHIIFYYKQKKNNKIFFPRFTSTRLVNVRPMSMSTSQIFHINAVYSKSYVYAPYIPMHITMSLTKNKKQNKTFLIIKRKINSIIKYVRKSYNNIINILKYIYMILTHIYNY